MRLRTRGRKCLVIFGVLAAPLSAGCARVDATGDYAQARQALEQRAQTSEPYDPALDAMVDQRVAEILDDGLSLDEAVTVALLNHRGFQAAFYGIGASRADVVQSGLLTNPSLGFSARFPEGGGRSNLTLTLAQELVDLWQIPVRRKVAEAQLEQTVLDVVRRGIELATEARTQFYELLTAERAETIAKENLELVAKSLEVAERRLRNGEAGQLDVNLLKTTGVTAQAMVLGAGRDKKLARADLARALGLSRWKQPWEIERPAMPGPAELADDPTLLIFAMSERLEAKIAAARVRSAEAELEKQFLSIVPSLSVGLDGERPERRALPGRKVAADTARASLRSGAPTAPDIQTRGERAIERRQIIDSLLGPSLQITLPLWDQNQAQIAKARFAVEQRRKEYEDLLDDVAQEVQRAAAVVRASEELVKYYEDEGLPTARENVELSRRAYEAGEQNILTLIEAQKAHLVQQTAALSVQRDLLVGLGELRRALGGRFPEASELQSPTSGPSTEDEE